MSHRTLAACLALASAASSQTPDVVYSGTSAGDAWGTVVEIVGDVDDDGVLDYAIASPDADVVTVFGTFADAGRVEIRSGADGSLLRLWLGDLGGLSRFGYAVADAGDVDGDGHDDVLVGAPRANGAIAASGVVYLYSGATGDELLRLDGLQTLSRFGHSLAGGRDANDDGVIDIVIGAPHHDDDDTNGGFGQEGAVWIYSSDGAFIDVTFGTTVTKESPGFPFNTTLNYHRRHWGWAVAFGGDVDLDGHDDVVATAPLTRVLSFTPPNTVHPPKEDAGFWMRLDVDSEMASLGGDDGDELGWSLASLGEIGGSPGIEFVVGAPGAGQYGAVYAIGSGLPTWYGTSAAPIGEVVAEVGDWDGDSARDVAIGSPTADVGSPFTIFDAGLVQVVSTGDGSVLAEFNGSTGNRIGASVAGAKLAVGAAPSLLIGAPEIDSPAVDAGAAWFYDGSACSDASATDYGTGWPGTLGVPALEATSPPELGATFPLSFDNSRGVTTPAWLAYGVSPSSTPFKGGTLLVAPLAFVPLTLPAGGLVLPAGLPDDDTLCGAHLYLQGLTTDPGASNGVSLTNGVDLLLGD